MTVARQKRGIASDNSITVQTRASHTPHKHSFTGGHLGVIPSKRAFSGWKEFVVEVVAHKSERK